MAVWKEFTTEEQAKWDEWKATRPPVVRDLADRFPPNRLFRLRSTGRRCHVLGYNEDGTMLVSVNGRFNRITFSHNVFGVEPENLEECDLPAPGEDVGDTAAEAGYTDENVKKILIPHLRKLVTGATGPGPEA